MLDDATADSSIQWNCRSRPVCNSDGQVLQTKSMFSAISNMQQSYIIDNTCSVSLMMFTIGLQQLQETKLSLGSRPYHSKLSSN